jgi:hypothetical protein
MLAISIYFAGYFVHGKPNDKIYPKLIRMPFIGTGAYRKCP